MKVENVGAGLHDDGRVVADDEIVRWDLGHMAKFLGRTVEEKDGQAVILAECPKCAGSLVITTPFDPMLLAFCEGECHRYLEDEEIQEILAGQRARKAAATTEWIEDGSEHEGPPDPEPLEDELPSRAPKIDFARAYASYGIKVFPLHFIQQERCSCGKPGCDKSSGKHPLHKGWQAEATSGPAAIRRLWAKQPQANIGIKCGADSNLTVVDADGVVGCERWRELELAHKDDTPETPTVLTGSGGLHMYFAYEPGLQNEVRWDQGLDLRTEGGLVVGVGSENKKGAYLWESSLTISEDFHPPKMPRWLVDAIKNGQGQRTSSTGAGTGFKVPEQSVVEGDGRNSMLYRAGRSMRAKGFPQTAISAALEATNQERCSPPLDADELRAILGSVLNQPDRPSFTPDSNAQRATQQATEQNTEETTVKEPGADDDREPDPPVEYSDIALSNRLADQQGANLRYVDTLGLWFIYDKASCRWVADTKLQVFSITKRLLTAIAHEALEKMLKAAALIGAKTGKENEKKADAIRTAARALANSLTSAPRVAAVVTLTRSHKRIVAVQEQFDADNWLLNTPGGAVDLKTGEIRPARRTDYFTKIAAVAPQQMETPLFDTFLHEIMGSKLKIADCTCAACRKFESKPAAEKLAVRKQLGHDLEVENLVGYLRRLYGYALAGDCNEHLLVIEIGEGGNGKGKLNDLMSKHIFGNYPEGYACEIPMEALTVAKGERHPTELMDLWHSRLALARESDADTVWNEGRVKALSGGDRVKARRMRQDFVEFEPTHTPFVFGNANPVLRGAGQAAWRRRLHMIPFKQLWATTPDPARNILQADKSLLDKLAAEAPGILQKLIDGMLEYLAGGRDLKPPETVLNASDEYLAAQNVMLQWLEEDCDRSNPNSTATANVLWGDFVAWCERNNELPGSRREFNAKLERAGIKVFRTMNERGICRSVKLRGKPDEEPKRPRESWERE